jgi:hypothetical protein
MAHDDKEAVDRALGYPYARPGTGSFLYGPGGVSGAHSCLRSRVSSFGSAAALLRAPELAGRTAILAIGSNAAPSQLARKFSAGLIAGAPIPVLAAQLEGWDVVYAALVSGYGAVAATIAPSPCRQTVVSTHVTMLTDAQVEVMHKTEGGYFCVRLLPERAKLTLSDGGFAWPASVPLYVYVCKFGAVVMNGSAIALAEIPAIKRDFVQADQAQMQRMAMNATRPQHGPSTAILPKQSAAIRKFVLENVNNKAARADCNQCLRRSAWRAGFDDGMWTHEDRNACNGGGHV